MYTFTIMMLLLFVSFMTAWSVAGLFRVGSKPMSAAIGKASMFLAFVGLVIFLLPWSLAWIGWVLFGASLGVAQETW